MRQGLVSVFLPVLLLLISCQSKRAQTSAPVDTRPGVAWTPENLEQLRVIASEKETLPADEKSRNLLAAPLPEQVRFDAGDPWDYDLGPDVTTESGRRLAALLKHPNVFYRGRLGENQVKVLIVGEDLTGSERDTGKAFSGPAGAYLQEILSTMGIDRGYLFLQGLAKAPPAVRQGLLKSVFENNRESLSLVLVTGADTQRFFAQSMRLWGAQCEVKPEIRLETCAMQGRYGTLAGLLGLSRDARVLGLPPMNPADATVLVKSQAVLGYLREWREAGWALEPDRDAKGKALAQKFDRGFQGRVRALPRGDVHFGFPDHTGGLEAGAPLWVDSSSPLFDRGPGEMWAKILTEQNPLPGRALYRGRWSDVEVLVIADQTAVGEDEAAGRALVGREGQRLQAFLQGLGVGSRYLILRTLPVDTSRLDSREVQKLLAASRAWRKKTMDAVMKSNASSLRLILTLGPQADFESDHFPQVKGLPVISATGPEGYEKAFYRLEPHWPEHDQRRPALRTEPRPIPAIDLPFGVK
ncbi:MAG: hypothetical protein KF865_03860 [Bdellovibrionaceae bacterium]|nr:hypothetical protein [Pseudobdellovibrionaceae bacterium]